MSADVADAGPLWKGWRWLKDALSIKRAPRDPLDQLTRDARGRRRLVNLADLWRDCLCNLRLIALSIVTFVLLGILYLAISIPKYDVSLRLMPIPEWLRSQPATQVSLFSAVQVNLFTLLGDAIQSKQIYQQLDANMDARHHIFRGLWDPRTKTWHQPRGLMGVQKTIVNDLKSLVGYPRASSPTIDDLRENVVARIELRTNSDGTIVVQMKSADPAFDVHMLRFVLDKADGVIRSEMIEYADETISGLKSQIDRTGEAMLRTALIDKLATQLTLKVGLQNNRIIALDMHEIEVSDMPMYPSFKGTLIVAFLIGLLLPVGLIFIRELRAD